MSTWRNSVGKFRYRASPLVEALCEFGFAPGAEWAPSVDVGLEDAFKSPYPQKKALTTIHTQVSVNEQGVQQGVLQGQRIQFIRDDGSAMVQIAPNTLTINQLTPYNGWDSFRPTILQGLKKYRRVTAPSGILRVHLRYINRIELQGNMVELDDWFEFSFRQPAMQELPGAAQYLVGARYPYDQHSLLKVELSSAPGGEDFVASVLDLEYTVVGENVLKFEGVEAWLDVAHTRIEAAWIGSITEKMHTKCEPEGIG